MIGWRTKSLSETIFFGGDYITKNETALDGSTDDAVVFVSGPPARYLHMLYIAIGQYIGSTSLSIPYCVSLESYNYMI